MHRCHNRDANSQETPGSAPPAGQQQIRLSSQRKDGQYTRAKGFDTFAPIGPCIAVGPGSEPRRVEGWVNGVRRQSSSTSQLIFSIEHILEYITFVMTLEPGDIVSTGTPEGIGPLVSGDTVTVKVEGVGELTNPVTTE